MTERKIFRKDRMIFKNEFLEISKLIKSKRKRSRGDDNLSLLVDANGVMISDKSAGKENKIALTIDKGHFSKEVIEGMVNDAEKYNQEDKVTFIQNLPKQMIQCLLVSTIMVLSLIYLLPGTEAHPNGTEARRLLGDLEEISENIRHFLENLRHLENLQHLQHLENLRHLENFRYLENLSIFFNWSRPYLRRFFAWFS